jgi:hypothetical protein
MLLAETLTQPSETPDLVIGIFETTRKGGGCSAALHNLPRLPQPHALTLSLATSAGVRGVWESAPALIQASKRTKATAHFIRPTRETGGPFDLPEPLRRWVSNCLWVCNYCMRPERLLSALDADGFSFLLRRLHHFLYTHAEDYLQRRPGCCV